MMTDIRELKEELLVTMKENAELREDLEFERSENGWAREFLDRMGRKCGTKDCPSLVAYVTKLEAENDKLRELVRIAIEYCVNGYCAEEDECPLYESRHSCRLHTEARDLGVEVDG